MKASEVRKRFIDYFVRQGHQHVPSSRLVPEGDPTLLFTNSGMVQFKNVFLGFDQRPYKRATTSQKCVRAGGKHNDLENVGHTTRHHTFFEMLGNFSFGDYFKKEAIRFAWDFLTGDLKIEKDKLWVTVFTNDDDAFDIWTKQEKVPAERISRFGEKDNFWQMGETGPCGPCSEIFYDHGAKNGCGKPDCKVGCSCDRFVEIWNLVFMQFNKDDKGKLTPLPKPSIDTGSGLERLSAVMQGVASNYDTDLFTDLFRVMEKESKKKYGSSDEVDVAMKVVADHARAATFLIADQVLPSNEGRGYVLRRIMRRGIRYGSKLSDKSLMIPTIRDVIRMMGDAYPEIREREDFILSTVQTEEARFNETLNQGTEILNVALAQCKEKSSQILDGETVFKLYDTYGFPVDLTTLIAKEAGISIDEEDFNRRMGDARKTAKASWKGGSGGDAETGLLMKATGSVPHTKFLGYETMAAQAKIIALFEQGVRVKELKGAGVAVFDQTPFYAEGGGQVGDYGDGRVSGASGVKFKITGTKKINDVFFHSVEFSETKTAKGISEGDSVDLTVSPERQSTMNNHSATHLLHAALRKVLGTHVSQSGSLVEAARLRFDFTHPKPMTTGEIEETEKLVNAEISSARDVGAKVLPYKKAIEEGAMALFGEKYGDEVRVIRMGDFSTELCGGTHVRNTADIRVFKITNEAGVSSGVRRIEAVTGNGAVEFLLGRHRQLTAIEDVLKSESGKSVEKVKKLVDGSRKLERDLKNALVQGQTINVDEIVSKSRVVKGVRVVSSVVSIDDREVLSSLSDKIKDKLKSGIVILIGTGVADDGASGGGASPIVVSVTKDLVAGGKFHAGNILKGVAALMDGKGGGRPDFAQGAAPSHHKAKDASEKAFELI